MATTGMPDCVGSPQTLDEAMNITAVGDAAAQLAAGEAPPRTFSPSRRVSLSPSLIAAALVL